MAISTRITYERLEQGADVYLLPTAVADVVVLRMALPGGAHAIYDRQTVAALVSEILPGSTKKHTRSAVRERFDELGASVSITEGEEHLFVSLRVRTAKCTEALTLLFEVLTRPVFQPRECTEAKARLHTALEHATEDTATLAYIAQAQLLYGKGHPHWAQSPKDAQRELKTVTPKDLSTFYAGTLSATGAVVVAAGDLPKDLRSVLRTLCAMLPAASPRLVPQVELGKTCAPKARDVVVSVRDKMNVDALLAIPLAVTREHSDFHALAFAVFVLGGSVSGRLFSSLRTRQSLTYGASASLAGMENGYPGFLQAKAIFPNDVFARARVALRHEVEQWARTGITSAELTKHKEEVAGRYTVGLSTTAGASAALFSAVLNGRAAEYVDEYPHRIGALTLRDVNRSIKEHVDYGLAVTASAGAIDAAGKPMV